MKKKPALKNKEVKPPKFIYLAGILLLTVIAYSFSLHNGFVSFDDQGYVTQNPIIKDISPHGLKVIFSSYVMANYHPLTVLLDAILYHFFGLNPFPFHLLNLLLHLINIVLVYKLVQLMLKQDVLAALGACIFAIHPMHVETVCWIADLKDVLYTLFYLTSIIFYIRYLTSGRYKFFLLTGLSFVLSLLSKSAAVTLPVVLFLVDYFYGKKLTLRSVIEKAPLFILSIIFGLINIKSQGSAGAFKDFSSYNFYDRICLPAYSLVYYFVTFFVPVHLSMLHPFPYPKGTDLPLIYHVSPFIVLVLVATTVWLSIKYPNRKRILLFGSAFFLVTIALVTQVKPIGQAIVSERYTYLPYLGLLIIWAYEYDLLLNYKPQLKTRVNILLGGVIVIFFFATIQRTEVWENSITLLSDVIDKYPDYPNAYAWRGEVKKDSANFQAAIEDFNKALEINPKLVDPYNNRGICKHQIKDNAGAVADYNKAIALNPHEAEAYCNRGLVKQDEGDYKGAIADIDTAILMDSSLYLTYYNRAIIKKYIKDYIGMINDDSKSIQLNPGFTEAYDGLAEARVALKDYKNAIADYNKAIELDPARAEEYNNRGEAKRYMEDYAGALADYNQAIAIDRNLLAAYNNRSIAEYFLGDYKGALADISYYISYKPEASAYNNRASIRLKVNDLEGAIQDYTAAINIFPSFTDAWLSRGLARFNLKDKNGACADWLKAASLGSAGGNQYLQTYCH